MYCSAAAAFIKHRGGCYWNTAAFVHHMNTVLERFRSAAVVQKLQKFCNFLPEFPSNLISNLSKPGSDTTEGSHVGSMVAEFNNNYMYDMLKFV